MRGEPNLDILFTNFKDVNTTDNDETDITEILQDINLNDENDILNTPFSQEEMTKSVYSLKSNKAAGYDTILK